MIHVFLEPAETIDLASVAASVKTRVVSWKYAAEMKLSVSSEALVIPSSTGTASAGLPPCSTTRLFSSRTQAYRPDRPKVARVSPGSVIFTLRQHLAHDDLDVFVVNLDPLQAGKLLHLVYQVFL